MWLGTSLLVLWGIFAWHGFWQKDKCIASVKHRCILGLIFTLISANFQEFKSRPHAQRLINDRWKTSLPSHRRSRSSAYLSWDNGYKRTWALLFSSDWVTILPACRRHFVKEKNVFKHKHSPPTPPKNLEAHQAAEGWGEGRILEGQWRGPWNPSLRCCPLL